VKVTREFGCFTDNLLTRETTRWTNLTLTTGNGLKICFLSVRFRNCISFTIPEIILLSSTKQNIQVFKHLKSSFRKIKRLLQSYEMNIKLSILEMYCSFVSMYVLLLINCIAPFHIAYPPK
jgi:hypothetical protein